MKKLLKRLLLSRIGDYVLSDPRLEAKIHECMLSDPRLGAQIREGTLGDPQLGAKIRECTLGDPHLAAKFYPYAPERSMYLLPKTSGDGLGAAELPVPPRELRWYPFDTPEQFLAWGRKQVEEMKSILGAAGFTLEPRHRVLDFGCGDGVLIRWFQDLAQAGEAWGVDINGERMVWCQQHLSPPLKFATTTSFPHLPFEDCYFDLVYATSVFTHIADLAEAWLLEVRRIVRPGGKLYLTVHDSQTVDWLLNKYPDYSLSATLRSFDEQNHFRTSGFAMVVVDRTPGEGNPGQAQVFYDLDYLRRHWGNYLKILSITPGVYDHQTAVLLEKHQSTT